jgi:hypothetical protein
MTTPEKAAANAANAQYSTGPTSPEGKARSSQNAVKHGLTAEKPVIPPERQAEFNRLDYALRKQCDPQGALELTVFDQLVHAAWKQQLVRDQEANLLLESPEALLDETKAKTLDRLQRYGAAAGRAWYRALKELRTLQTERTLRGTIPDEIVALIPTLASLPAITKQQAVTARSAAQSLKDEMDAIMNTNPAPGFMEELCKQATSRRRPERWVRFVNSQIHNQQATPGETSASSEQSTRGQLLTSDLCLLTSVEMIHHMI